MLPGDPFAQDLNGKWFANAWRLLFCQNRQQKQWFKLLNPHDPHVLDESLPIYLGYSYSPCLDKATNLKENLNLFSGLLLEVQILSQLSQNMQLLLQEMVKNLRSGRENT